MNLYCFALDLTLGSRVRSGFVRFLLRYGALSAPRPRNWQYSLCIIRFLLIKVLRQYIEVILIFLITTINSLACLEIASVFIHFFFVGENGVDSA